MKSNNSIVVFAGGVGAARFLQGLTNVVSQKKITVIVNTGDDKTFYGLHVSPDIDIILYTLSGVVDTKQGWGVKNESFAVMKQLTAFGYEDWFTLGDKDLALHIHRTNLLRQGKTLSEITKQLTKNFNLKLNLIPMSNDPVPTFVTTPKGTFHFEEYFVKQRFQPEVVSVQSKRSTKAKPAPGVLEAIANAQTIIFAPSNPVVSIGTILSIPGIRTAIKKSKARKVAISPIVKGFPIKGPADKLMRSQHLEVSVVGVAKGYQKLIDGIVIDTQDAKLKTSIEQLGLSVLVTDTIMKDIQIKTTLAQKTVDFAYEQ